MDSNAFSFNVYFRKNKFLIVFFLVWFVGFFAGFSFFRTFKQSELLLMRSVVFQPVSIVGLICAIFLPLLCTYISVLINKPMIALVLSFLKAASFSFSLSLLTLLYGSASWLLCVLCMFSDTCFLLILFAVWLQYPVICNVNSKRLFTGSFILGLLILFGDYFVVSPFLIGLL